MCRTASQETVSPETASPETTYQVCAVVRAVVVVFLLLLSRLSLFCLVFVRLVGLELPESMVF